MLKKYLREAKSPDPIPGSVEEDFEFGKEDKFLSRKGGRHYNLSQTGVRYDGSGSVLKRSVLGNPTDFEKMKFQLSQLSKVAEKNLLFSPAASNANLPPTEPCTTTGA